MERATIKGLATRLCFWTGRHPTLDLLVERPFALLGEPPEGNSQVPVPALTALALTVPGGHCLGRDMCSRS